MISHHSKLEENSNNKIWLWPSTVYSVFFIAINVLNLLSIFKGRRLNTWDIYRYSFHHLINHQDLYLIYPSQYSDLYLYTPTFAFLFAPFSTLPYYLSYFLWNNLLMMIIPFMVYRLKNIDATKKSLICYIAFIECLTCLQGTQTNTLVAALFLITFISFENGSYWVAAIAIALGFYIKIYPLAAASLFILYPGKLRFLVKLFIAFAVLALLPLVIIKPAELFWQYKNWLRTVLQYQHDNYGVSVMGLIGANFSISDWEKVMVQVTGLLIYFLGYLRSKLFSNYMYRLYFFSSMLIWVAIFNHGAEDFSYSIAIIGIAIWYISQPGRKMLDWFIVLFIIVACISPVDPTPKPIIHFVITHKLKALPFFMMWLLIIYQMLFKKKVFFDPQRLHTG